MTKGPVDDLDDAARSAGVRRQDGDRRDAQVGVGGLHARVADAPRDDARRRRKAAELLKIDREGEVTMADLVADLAAKVEAGEPLSRRGRRGARAGRDIDRVGHAGRSGAPALHGTRDLRPGARSEGLREAPGRDARAGARPARFASSARPLRSDAARWPCVTDARAISQASRRCRRSLCPSSEVAGRLARRAAAR